jgi:hypothetical protein
LRRTCGSSTRKSRNNTSTSTRRTWRRGNCYALKPSRPSVKKRRSRDNEEARTCRTARTSIPSTKRTRKSRQQSNRRKKKKKSKSTNTARNNVTGYLLRNNSGPHEEETAGPDQLKDHPTGETLRTAKLQNEPNKKQLN